MAVRMKDIARELGVKELNYQPNFAESDNCLDAIVIASTQRTL